MVPHAALMVMSTSGIQRPAAMVSLADPEQLFATGWSASFDGTMALAALKVKVVLSDNTAIDATVDLCLVDGAYFLQAHLNASLSDMPPEVVRLLEAIEQRGGPYPKAIRGNIDVSIGAI